MRQIIGFTLFAGMLLAAVVHLESQAKVSAPVVAVAPERLLETDALIDPQTLMLPFSRQQFIDRLNVETTLDGLDHNATGNALISTAAKTDSDLEFQRIMQWAISQKLTQRSLPEMLQAVSERFLGAAYQDNLLDRSGKETLVVSLKEFDCVLFVETVLAITRGVALQDYSYSAFTHNLQDQRYWKGTRDGYCSRLHYFSAWIQDNEKRNTVKDLSATLGGISLNKPLNFMSSHWQKYPQLLNNAGNRQCIRNMEARIDPASIKYIPHQQIASLYPKLQPGDIVAIVADIPGLDVTHTGLIYRTVSGNIGLIHAAPQVGVKISTDLQTYIDQLGAPGILVARPIDPRPQ